MFSGETLSSITLNWKQDDVYMHQSQLLINMQVSPIRQEKEKTSQLKRRNKTVLICRYDCMCKKTF